MLLSCPWGQYWILQTLLFFIVTISHDSVIQSFLSHPYPPCYQVQILQNNKSWKSQGQKGLSELLSVYNWFFSISSGCILRLIMTPLSCWFGLFLLIHQHKIDFWFFHASCMDCIPAWGAGFVSVLCNQARLTQTWQNVEVRCHRSSTTWS